ncbi:MAG: CRISPR-associated endonuclease Cas1 [Desulfobacterales bacterium]|nr:CRISPR-associated endonuclease Cas1 [Desulfobacterales bacterium]
MSILYVADQGVYLKKDGNRILVEKGRTTIQWVHAFKVEQIVLMGNIFISPGTIAFLLQEGIDTVFMSIYGKYRGRLISAFGKNIELRRAQFKKFEDEKIKLETAKKYIQGKITNCRILLRRYNQEMNDPEVTSALHQLRILVNQISDVASIDSLMGIEGKSAAVYFGCFGKLLKVDDIQFNGRNRRPPKDPVNVLLSLGYSLLANTIQTQVNVVGLDPYLGCLHSVEYGRASLILDLMEEFRPVLIDSIVLKVINKKIIRATDFYRPEDKEPAAFDFVEEGRSVKDYPILLTHVGMKKFIMQYESRLEEKVYYALKEQTLSYRAICLEKVRMLARYLKSEEDYIPFIMR